MLEVRWRHDRSRLILPAAVLPPLGAQNESVAIEVRALLDTGVTASGIIPQVASALTLHSLGKKPVQTAGGLIQADRFAFRVGFYGHADDGTPTFPFVLDKTLYGIGIAESGNFEIIIGMDVIGLNHLELDPDGSCLVRFETAR